MIIDLCMAKSGMMRGRNTYGNKVNKDEDKVESEIGDTIISLGIES